MVIWITDYGIVETHGLSKHSTEQAIELALIDSLKQFTDSETFADAQPLLVLVDSGDFTASMGPPLFSDGNLVVGSVQLQDCIASMGPPLFSDGNMEQS